MIVAVVFLSAKPRWSGIGALPAPDSLLSEFFGQLCESAKLA